jgi:hypothetical protein
LRQAGFKQVLVLDSTVLVPAARDLRVLPGSVWADSAHRGVDEALADLHLNSIFRWPIDKKVVGKLGAETVALRPADTSALGPDGPPLLTLSAVGVSTDSAVLAVYWEYYCGPLCGGATISFFKRDARFHWMPWRGQMLYRR